MPAVRTVDSLYIALSAYAERRETLVFAAFGVNITPAHVGKSLAGLPPRRAKHNHPRTRGENLSQGYGRRDSNNHPRTRGEKFCRAGRLHLS